MDSGFEIKYIVSGQVLLGLLLIWFMVQIIYFVYFQRSFLGVQRMTMEVLMEMRPSDLLRLVYY